MLSFSIFIIQTVNNTMVTIILFILIALLLGLGWNSYNKVANPKWKVPQETFPLQWRELLNREVLFYYSLDSAEKARFEYKVQEFLLNCRITGVKTDVDLRDKLLVASSAIIPVFGFDSWKYSNIREVLLYPAMFDENYQFEGESDRMILGMVGNQNMEGIMILSKEALRLGFKNESDKQNTAIHEFVHLIDKSDGEIDGVPKLLMERQYALPWINLITKEMEHIYERKSDINPYGGTNRAEFFSVVSEYFFERPKLLEEKHPELYTLLEKIFNQKMSDRLLTSKKNVIGRNDPCVCNSGEKFKHCCGSVHY
ncbi:zinc-dependent peptidase [Fluviicola sp.]|uniref:zinc-dependent peptidase n=1 Tax=Fluviicola sp. TaxID=1917219 RepID=UPI00261B3986|nr:zinc-dependent peptidase [Fluviicola sp.]